MNGPAEFLVVLALGFALGLGIGHAWANDGWRIDCEKLGRHYHDGKAYECKLGEVK